MQTVSDKHQKLELSSDKLLHKQSSSNLQKKLMYKISCLYTRCAWMRTCVSAPMWALVPIHIFILCVYSISLDVCVYTTDIPFCDSQWHWFMHGLCACVCVRCLHTHKSYNWYSNLLPQVRPNCCRFSTGRAPAKVQTAWWGTSSNGWLSLHTFK